jgi:hypothetical protein
VCSQRSRAASIAIAMGLSGGPSATRATAQGVAIEDLPAASARSSISLGGVLGVRQLSNGNVFVNDAGRRQLHLLDSALVLRRTVRDSMPGSTTSYGPHPVPMIAYLGDSSLLADHQGGSLLVMAPTGQVTRVMAASHPSMLLALAIDYGAVDSAGRILFSADKRDFSRGVTNFYSKPESSVVVRADMETRRADTLAEFKTWPSTMMAKTRGSPVTRFTADPIPLTDQWAALSDGSIAIVRGYDYHIDWIRPDGSRRSAPKMPFDWKRLTDEDKQKLIDSTREAVVPEMARAMGQRRAGPPSDEVRGGRGSSGPPPEQGPPAPVEYVPPTYKEMFDFQPPIRRGALMPDLDGNLWILPSTSAQSKNGELVYDVTNAKGDFRRVRVPAGRSIIGFGKGGVVYLLLGDKTRGFYLERTRLPRSG